MYKNLNVGALGHSASFDIACQLAKNNGFEGIDLDLNFLSQMASEQSVAEAKAWFAKTGLRAGGMSLNVAWRENDSDSAFEDSLDKLGHSAALASELGCTRCFTWVMPRSDKHTFYEHFYLATPRLQHVADVLAQYGISLGLEFVGPETLRAGHRHDFVHTLDGMRTFAAVIGLNSHKTGLLLDAFHWWTSHGTFTELSHLDAAEIVYVHVNDAVQGRNRDEQIDQQREMVGATGVIPIKRFFNTLRQIGYDGPVTVEPFNAAIKALPLEKAIEVTSTALDFAMK
jgi:sugar phosphate isomerase/epimerase